MWSICLHLLYLYFGSFGGLPSLALLKPIINQCRVCQGESNKPVEPFRPTTSPKRLWQMLGADLFHYKGHMYLLLIDYISWYSEIAMLGSDSSSRNVVVHIKNMFSRHMIPDCLIYNFKSCSGTRFYLYFQKSNNSLNPMGQLKELFRK